MGEPRAVTALATGPLNGQRQDLHRHPFVGCAIGADSAGYEAV